MRYSVVEDRKMPAYQQIYYAIRDDIIAGVYTAGNKLPSKRILAYETGVSTITIEHAYALLSDEGYIEARERSGYYVIFKAEEGYYIHTASSDALVSFQTGETPDAGAFSMSVLKRAMRFVLNEHGESILTRPPNRGCVELRQAIVEYLKRCRGISASIEQIVIGAGSEYLYGLIVGLLGREKVYAFETPSYKKIEQVYAAHRVTTDSLKLGTDGIETDELNNCDADVLHISPYRSYPSGVTASATKRHEYLDWASKHDRYIIEDDFESEFSVLKKNEDTLFSQSAQDNIIYLNTFSKTISPAFRVGYAVIPKHLVKEYEDKLGFYSCTVSSYIQLVLARLISCGDFERHINRIRRQKRRENKQKRC